MTAQVACVECGKPVSERIARRMKGLCSDCLGRETKYTRTNPFNLFYNSLQSGFTTLLTASTDSPTLRNSVGQ
jgi:hypothetical protein